MFFWFFQETSHFENFVASWKHSWFVILKYPCNVERIYQWEVHYGLIFVTFIRMILLKFYFFLFFLIILILDLTVNAKLSYKPRNLENKWFLLKTRFITLNILFVCRVKNKLDFCFFSVNISFIFFCESFSANGLADVTSGGITITQEAAKIKTGTNVFSYMAETDPENFDRVPYFILVKKQIFKTKYL